MPVRTFGNQVGICWVVCVRMLFPKLVLSASIKVGNEEKFFALRTSLLNLEDFFFMFRHAHNLLLRRGHLWPVFRNEKLV
jgi:hypothetical protein